MPFSKDEFLADVLKSVDPSKHEAIKEAFTDESLSKAVGEQVMRQSEFSRRMDEQKVASEAATGELDAQRAQLEAERARLTSWFQDASADYKTAKDENTAYRSEYGELEGPSKRIEHSQPSGITTDDFDKRLSMELEKHDRQAIQFMDIISDIKLDHRDRFSEKLNTESLYAHAEKTGLPMAAAYEDMVRPRIEEARDAKHKEEISQARKEAVAEYASQHNLPTGPDPNIPTASKLLGLDKPTDQDSRVAAAVADYRSNNPAGF